MLVVPRLAWPSWRWKMLSGTPSRASSIAWTWRSWSARTAPHARLGGEPAELDAHARARPRPLARWAVDDAEQRPDRELKAGGNPRLQLLPAPRVHADLAAPAALAAAQEQGPAARVEVAVAQRQRLL